MRPPIRRSFREDSCSSHSHSSLGASPAHTLSQIVTVTVWLGSGGGKRRFAITVAGCGGPSHLPRLLEQSLSLGELPIDRAPSFSRTRICCGRRFGSASAA